MILCGSCSAGRADRLGRSTADRIVAPPFIAQRTAAHASHSSAQQLADLGGSADWTLRCSAFPPMARCSGHNSRRQHRSRPHGRNFIPCPASQVGRSEKLRGARKPRPQERNAGCFDRDPMRLRAIRRGGSFHGRNTIRAPGRCAMDHVRHPSILVPFDARPGRKQRTLAHCARLRAEDLRFVQGGGEDLIGRLQRLLVITIIGIIRNA